jgi:predicted molibdopterin-dependent oxidoreductase YjgC
MIRVSTRRGKVEIKLRSDRERAAGHGVHPLLLAEAAANLLTNAALDPFGKIPEFKFCAAKVETSPAGPQLGGANKIAARRLVDGCRGVYAIDRRRRPPTLGTGALQDMLLP